MDIKLLAHLLCMCLVWYRSKAEVTEVTFNLYENTKPGQLIGNIAEESRLFENVSDEIRDNVRFSYLKNDPIGIYLILDDVTSELNTSNIQIDREKVCEFSVECVKEFEIAARSGIFFSIVTVKIVILDLNDNAPVFNRSSLILNISEKANVGTEFSFESAYDADMWGNNSIQNYAIDQSENLFELLDRKFDDDHIILRLIMPLDRELKDSYLVKVIASDGGEPMRQGILTIRVTVIDENDNTPEFTSEMYNVTIDENIEPNTVIVNLSATDLDIGTNGDITYRIMERQSNIETIKRIFAVNKKTGEIIVLKELVLETLEYYEFIVEAEDNGNPSRLTRSKVIVNVNDVENNPPIIKANLLSPGNIGFVDISENEPEGFFVAHVNVEDNDKGKNGEFSCNVESSLFKLEVFPGNGFKVVVSGELDREVSDTHNVTIVCQDGGSPVLTSSESFLVRVTDVNDNSPIFAKPIYPVKILENNAIMQNVTQVSARDLDAGLNGQIEYLIHENDKDLVVINNETGMIHANKSFDRELTPIVVVRVLAVDKGETPRTGSTTVSITLIDVNDCAPVIVPIRPEFRISENLQSDTLVGTLYAVDKDTGDNGQFSFSLLPIQTKFPFVVLPSGEIRTSDSLDREKQSRYEVPVVVTDSGTRPLSSTHYVTIYVTDENDNSPIITFPNDINDTVQFKYPVVDYNVVTSIAAYDIDEGENSTLSYFITDGNQFNIFEIDPKLGELSVKKVIDIKQDITVTLKIEVRDKGKEPKATNATLIVQLIYANATSSVALDAGVGNKYVIISVVVIVTTVAIAVAIVGIILFLRSMDKNKHEGEDGCGRYSDSGISSRSDSQSLPPDMDLAGTDDGKAKKKKEVSFSLDFSPHNFEGGRHNESSTDDDIYKQNRYYDGPPTSTPSYQSPTYGVQSKERIDSHMKALKLQQYLWEAKTRDWDQTQVHQLPLGDSESETSRETITCDSGRGGSEDDVSTSSPITEDRRSFNFKDSKTTLKHPSYTHQPYNTHNPRDSLPAIRENIPIHYNTPPPRPPAYRSHSADGQINNTKLAIKNLPNTNKLTNESAQRQSNHRVDMWRDYFQHGGIPVSRMRHDSCSSVRSNEDDGGSTTTSGSYTLEQDEIDMNMYTRQMDVVV